VFNYIKGQWEHHRSSENGDGKGLLSVQITLPYKNEKTDKENNRQILGVKILFLIAILLAAG
jgi:hypothetical protein